MKEFIPFFSNMPDQVIPFAAKFWDEATSPDYNGQTAYQDFVADLQFLRIDLPSRAIAKRWVAGVQAGLIPRPGGEKPKPETPVKHSLLAAELFPQTGGVKILGIVPEVSPRDMDEFADRLFNSVLAEIQQEATTKAAKLVASRLREIADRYDALAA